MSLEARLSNAEGYTSFTYNDNVIRFRTSPKLEKYIKILKWDKGYLEVIAQYQSLGEVEEYIDLIPILENLYIESDEFLKPIKEVTLDYDKH